MSLVVTMQRVTPSDASHPHCPVCGYDRAGIASDSPCPECGAEGFSGLLVVHGTARIRGDLGLIALICLSALMLFVFGTSAVMRIGNATTITTSNGRLLPNYVNPPPDVGDWIFIAVLAAVVAISLWRLLRRRRFGAGVLRTNPIVWTFHPRGIEIASDGSRRLIPRHAIKRIECRDSLFGSVSQFVLVVKTLSVSLGSTPVLYVEGPKETRRGVLRKMREQYPE